MSCGTLVSASRFNFSDTGLLPSLEVLSRTLLLSIIVHVADPQPHPTVVGWFGLLRFRSPLLTKSMFLSFPPPTKMFQFPGCPSRELWIHSRMTEHYFRRVSPFRHPRIKACLRLPVAFRSLPRLSSASSAMASTLRPS